uniref:Uncharacterized protein n=1 Tax=Rhizophora mucronata TaxID=61149 RepID=A0A2P2NNH4_RHIMU
MSNSQDLHPFLSFARRRSKPFGTCPPYKAHQSEGGNFLCQVPNPFRPCPLGTSAHYLPFLACRIH